MIIYREWKPKSLRENICKKHLIKDCYPNIQRTLKIQQ